jgi:fatty-acyl-CoA synthase
VALRIFFDRRRELVNGLMMDYPLTLQHFIERAGRLYPDKEIVTRLPGGMHRYHYGDFYRRTHRLAKVLQNLGVKPGERVGTLAWNNYRHLELYFAITCYGAVLHTLNLRLSTDDLTYIINHAEDRVIFVDASLAPILEKIRDRIPCVREFVVTDGAAPSPDASNYEDLMNATPDDLYAWPRLDEGCAAGMCYTSGTTGNPKGVVYSHRALFLHSMAFSLADTFALSERDVVLQVVPMFHANGWGKPFAAVMTGSKIVLPGEHPQPRDIARLIQDERVTLMGAVPTIWIGLHNALQEEKFDVSSMRLAIGAGSAIPKKLIETYQKEHGIELRQLWGMTETTPVGTVSTLKSYLACRAEDECFAVQAKQGLPSVGIDIRAVDEKGQEIPWDGATMGELQVRGPWVTSGYYNDARSAAAFVDGWFRTGDVATIDQEGYIQLVDRAKDVIKSGGEWISSVDLENAIMGHPKVLEAAVIAIEHPTWLERPIAVVVPKPQFRSMITAREILEYLEPRFAKWWLPDEIIFSEAVPKTSVGKFDKKVLRAQFKGYVSKAGTERSGVS